MENWNSLEPDTPIDLDDDVDRDIEDDELDDDEVETPSTNVKASEAITYIDKAISWAEANTNCFSDIQVLHGLRQKAVLKSLAERKKQLSIRDFLQSK